MPRKKKVVQVQVEEDDDEDQVERPTDLELQVVIRRLIPKVNLQKTGVKAFIKLLSKECGGLDLKHRADFIKEALSEAINDIDEEDEIEDDKQDEAPPVKKKRAAGRGLSVKKEISDAMANFLGQGKEMSRTDIVKALWDYIKEHQLQNPENKREIVLDPPMKAVFGCDTFTMFTMNKYVAAHVHPFKPLDLTPKVKTPKKKVAAGAGGGTPKKRKRKGGTAAVGASSSNTPAKKKRKPKKPGLQPPYRLSKEMAAVVGKDVLPRPQVVTALWNYIKEHNLQNPQDKREIFCDAKLSQIMGGNKSVTMFTMNRYITNHLLEKLDRSAYNHEEEAVYHDDDDDNHNNHNDDEDEDDDDEEEEEEEEEESEGDDY